jgi:hypothetical protein
MGYINLKTDSQELKSAPVLPRFPLILLKYKKLLAAADFILSLKIVV